MKKAEGIGKSQRVAISFMARLIYGLLPQALLPKPNWAKFDWFHAIKLDGKIEKSFASDSKVPYYYKLSRTIKFCGYRDTLIAEISLVVTEFENTDNTKPNFWRVAKIRYRNNYDESNTSRESKWTTVEVSREVSPLS